MSELFDHQKNFVEGVVDLPSPARACLFFKTGAGKSRAALEGMKALGYSYVLVVTPPSTHKQWLDLGRSMGIGIVAISHAKFRMKDYQISRSVPIIMDEVHLLGGQKGKGWRKFDTACRHIKAPVFMLSGHAQLQRCGALLLHRPCAVTTCTQGRVPRVHLQELRHRAEPVRDGAQSHRVPEVRRRS